MDANLSSALQAVSTALRPVHGVLLDATRVDYEKEHGKVPSKAALLQLVLQDAAFAWLKPFSELMVRMDVLSEADEVDPREVLALRAAVESWTLRAEDEEENGFQARYIHLLQERPELVIAHVQLRSALKELEKAALPLQRPLFATSSDVPVGYA